MANEVERQDGGRREKTMKPTNRLPRTEEELKKLEYRNSTVTLLRLRNEVFLLGGMSRETFTREYLNGLGSYERRIAREEGIKL